MRALIALVALLVANAAEAKPDIYWLVEFEHVSDLLRGDAPWAEHTPEPYHDHVMTGATFDLGKRRRFSIDMLQGYKRLAGTAGDGSWQTGTTFRVRMYPRGRR